MIKAVIFDLYGTLLRLPTQPAVHLTLLQRSKVADLRAAIDLTMSTDLPSLQDLCRLLRTPSPSNIDQLESDLESQIDSVGLYSDAMPTLRELANRGLQIGLISNLATPYKRPFFSLLLDELVNVPVFSCDCGMVKPDPRIYTMAVDQLGVAASEIVMVGDSRKCDVVGPSAIGIKGVHLVRHHTSKAVHSIDSLDQVIPYANAK